MGSSGSASPATANRLLRWLPSRKRHFEAIRGTCSFVCGGCQLFVLVWDAAKSQTFLIVMGAGPTWHIDDCDIWSVKSPRTDSQKDLLKHLKRSQKVADNDQT